MLAWAGRGTSLPVGFAALRLETNWLHCYAEEMMPYTEAEAEAFGSRDPVQLLCRALRLAPACYRRFELTARHPDAPLEIASAVLCIYGSDQRKSDGGKAAKFGSVAELAVSMRQHAAAEGLTVQYLPDDRSIVVCRLQALR